MWTFENKMNNGAVAVTRYMEYNKPFPGIHVDVDGKVLTKEEWVALPESTRAEIMGDAMRFKAHLRKISQTRFLINKILGTTFFEKLSRELQGLNFIGTCDTWRICTPILEGSGAADDMPGFIRVFELAIQQETKYFKAPKTLVGTELGQTILNELKNTEFGLNVFCHNALDYNSFVVINGKLSGIVNWQYAGYYPQEFEDLIVKYLSVI